MNKIDLLLGGDIGDWALDNVPAPAIGHVITLDDQIAERAQSLGHSTILGNANSLDYQPAPYGFSVHYPAILKPEFLNKYRKTYNLHPGYLPWGRGYYPIFWALWEQTPAGATLHEISPGIDEGPIVAQTQVQYNEGDTGGSLFLRVRQAEQNLFLKYLPLIIEGKDIPTEPQASGGSYHRKREFDELKHQADWDQMSAKDLVRLARAFTFPGHSGLELAVGSHRVEISLNSLSKVD
ncbi:MAG TPA: formyltransferase family protein [Pyrinomonadaceae bacterium]|nr:formyltransferase family protein [Pyrinomonadaceae bacterium]